MSIDSRKSDASAGAALRAVAPSPTERIRVRMELRDLPRSLVGDQPDHLADLLETAIYPPVIRAEDSNPLTDFGAAKHLPTIARDIAAVSQVLAQLLRLGAKAAKLPLGEEGVPTEQQPWLDTLDHVVMAAMGLPGIKLTDEDAVSLATAMRLISTVKLQKPANAKSGPAAIKDAVRAAVRATVYFRHSHGLSIDSRWNSSRATKAPKGSRRTDAELLPVSETAELCCNVVRALGITSSNASIKSSLDAFIDQLQGEHRTPTAIDLNEYLVV
jgi:hypothetical protein